MSQQKGKLPYFHFKALEKLLMNICPQERWLNLFRYNNVKMKHRLIYISFIFLVVFSFSEINAQTYYDNAEEHQCLKCHSSQTYTFHNSLMEYEEKKLMNPFYIMDTVALKTGVHSAFDCTDCHSYEYSEYPHKGAIKLEPLPKCLDCHGGSDTPFQFDKIHEEFEKSVHYQVYGDNFSCSKCHNIHTYHPVSTTSSNVAEIVEYSNSMCLSCHNDMKQYNLVSGRTNPEIVEIHDWLPNQQLHFENVRCLECHTEIQEGIMVSHNILKKENAIRKCAECHTQNSRLKASLYKYQNLQQRSEDGTLRTVISNQSYVIGTHQVPLLKTLGVIIFILAFVGIAIHLAFRIIYKK